MANLSIREYETLMVAQNGGVVPVGVEPAIATQLIAIGGSSVQSAAFNARTKFVRVGNDAICNILFGTNPTAINAAGGGTGRLAADHVEYWGVSPGQKLAVITDT